MPYWMMVVYLAWVPSLFAPWPSCSLANSFPGLFAPGNESSMELSFPGTFTPLMCLSLCTFTVLRLHSHPLLSAKTKITKNVNEMGANALIKYQITSKTLHNA